MKKMILLAALLLLSCGMAYAQVQDSIIIHSANVDSGVTSQFIRINAVTFDSVAFYQMSIKWYGGTGVHLAQGCTYWGILPSWDVTYDTLVLGEGYLRTFGFMDTGGDDNPPMVTGGQRMHIITARMVFEPNIPPQMVRLDTTTDGRMGSAFLGLKDGRTVVVPVYVPGIINYGITGVDDPSTNMPTAIALNQNYPNPFNPETNIEFALPTAQNVTLQIYNLLGQTVKTLVSGQMDAGYHTARWNGTNENGSQVPSGVYFFRLSTDNFTKTNKMILLR